MKTLITTICFLLTSSLLFAQSELNNAIRMGKLSKVKQIVQANPGALNKEIEYNGYPLHVAAWNIKPDIVEWILTQDSTIKANTKDKKKKNTLHYLLGNKYLKNSKSKGAEKILEMLKKAGADINAKEEDGFTPLHLVVLSYPQAPQVNLPFIRYMLEQGANPKTINKRGTSPVMSMCHMFTNLGKLNMSRFEIVKLLMENGADPNIPDPAWDKNTVLTAIMLRGTFPEPKDKHAAVKWLIENGAKTNIKNKKKQSAKSLAKKIKKKDKKLYKIITKTKALKK